MLEDIEWSRFSFDIRIHSEYEFRNIFVWGDTAKETGKIDFVRSDSLNGGNRSSEYMVKATIDSRALDRDHIEIVLDDTKDVGISPWIRAYSTEGMISISHSETLGTLGYIFMKFSEYFRKVFHIGRIRLEQKKRELSRGFLPNSGKEIDHIDESFECFRQKFIVVL